jgi:hypothetical protein
MIILMFIRYILNGLIAKWYNLHATAYVMKDVSCLQGKSHSCQI